MIFIMGIVGVSLVFIMGIVWFSLVSGHVGQIRINLRKDIDPASYGRCSVDEIRGSQPHGDDVILIAKVFMADAEPYAVKTLLTAEQASALQNSFAQPAGIADRRPLDAQVRANVHAKVKPLIKQGFLSLEAAAYLTNWVDGTLQQTPRPMSYPCLAYRYEPVAGNLGAVVAWQPQRRERHIDLKVPNERLDHAASDSESDGGRLDPVP